MAVPMAQQFQEVVQQVAVLTTALAGERQQRLEAESNLQIEIDISAGGPSMAAMALSLDGSRDDLRSKQKRVVFDSRKWQQLKFKGSMDFSGWLKTFVAHSISTSPSSKNN